MAIPEIPDDFLRYLAQCSIIGFFTFAARVTYYRFHYGWKDSVVWPGLLFVTVAGLLWQAVVTLWVPEPYLDEIFHIPQAQKYCQLRWYEWDDKITTPPGLYLLSFAIQKFTWIILGDCSPLTLRMTNWLAIIFLAFVALQCRRLIEARLAERESESQQSRPPYALSIFSVHTGVNIALFPLLFFFSGLYYTDVFSTLAVLVAFWNHLERVGLEAKGWKSDALVIVLGIGSLFMRQTNVFWVGLFMGGLEAVHIVKGMRPPPTRPGQFNRQTLIRFYLSRYSHGDVHDPPLNEAGLEDVLYCAMSIAIAIVCNPLRVFRQVWAHIAVMGLFGAFVLWNGGVVLGDKANHVVTVHLSQLLYIWPLFAFFSAPLVVSWVVQTVSSFLPGENTRTTKQSKQSTPSPYASFLNLAGYASLAPLALAIVRLNTIIHPFTLADNRHYMFYVFRYSILRSPVVRFALVPVYIVCGILCWKTLAGFGMENQVVNDHEQTQETLQAAKLANGKTVAKKNRSKSKERGKESNKTEKTSALHDHLSSPTSTSHLAPSLSTALLWILATTLSLFTAPLVEPRYFILPWVFWRLLLPAWALPQAAAAAAAPGFLKRLGQRYDLRLWVESIWFVLINVATMYIFITRPFYWYAPDGTLADEGRVQRFMW
ncbi:glucosyltransferase [Gnomoniopsis smithogilvyi]|uniref:Dol-P-Glc:Glc(2)Man(9)GlcNAc(2)-PP-Dol alpha-1,2-glucosyltransferase n=1 Tax=Gnomoniopsis smithogilvyi TaxID=1191159 RepID=A0A9W8YT12_9PEZI|nr:glucosyltransferase [Gnomoniopsis smithogilvyi]